MIDERDRDILRYEYVSNGATSASKITSKGHRLVNPSQVDKWLRARERKSTPPVFQTPGKYVNHFTIGADPEFTFIGPGGRQFHAADARLGLGTFVGCDANNRLAELRPAPNRSALYVVASLLSELRALYMLSKTTHSDLDKLQWVAFPFLEEGIGGHIQFGRLRDDRRKTSDAPILDKLADWLESRGVFNVAASQWRRQNTNRGQYGGKSDLRLQPFGYEYRTMPTWAENPWLSFFVLTLAKLLVHDGKVSLDSDSSAKHLLAYYAPFDDDAALALHVLQQRGMPCQSMVDMRTTWGLTSDVKGIIMAGLREHPYIVMPATITPTKQEVKDVWEHFTSNKPLKYAHSSMFDDKDIIPSTAVTPAVYMSQTDHPTIVDELLVEVVGIKQYPVRIEAFNTPEGSRPYIAIGCSQQLRHIVPQLEAAFLPVCSKGSVRWSPRPQTDTKIVLSFSRDLLHPRYKQQMHALLLKGVLPLWHYKKIDSVEVKRWASLKLKQRGQAKDASVYDAYNNEWVRCSCVA